MLIYLWYNFLCFVICFYWHWTCNITNISPNNIFQLLVHYLGRMATSAMTLRAKICAEETLFNRSFGIFTYVHSYTHPQRHTHTVSNIVLYAIFCGFRAQSVCTVRPFSLFWHILEPFICFMEKDKWSNFFFRSHHLRVAVYDVSHNLQCKPLKK